MKVPPMPPPAIPPEISPEKLELVRSRLALSAEKAQTCAKMLPQLLALNNDPRWQETFGSLIRQINLMLVEIEETYAILTDEPMTSKERMQ